MVNDGDYAAALKVASSHLGPLAANNEALLKPLKETLLALLEPSEDALAKGIPLPILATSLQVKYKFVSLHQEKFHHLLLSYSNLFMLGFSLEASIYSCYI